MKQIKFKKLVGQDFQGIKKIEFDFSDSITEITGTNGVGKSTILDMIMWCLSSKNMHDKSDTNFKILPLDKENHERTDAKPNVKLTINDGEKDYTFERSLKLTFQNKEDVDGTVTVDRTVGVSKLTSYFMNGTKLKQGDFNAKITEIMGDLKTVKLLTNVLQFLSNTPEKEQRSLMLQYIEPVTHERMVKIDDRYATITELEDLPFEQVLKSVRTQINDQEKSIQAEKSELKGMKTSLSLVNVDEDIDYDNLELQRSTHKDTLSDMRKSNSASVTNQNEINTLNQEKTRHQFKLDNFEEEFNRDKQFKIDDVKRNIQITKGDINGVESKLTDLREDWNKIDVERQNVEARVDEDILTQNENYRNSQTEIFENQKVNIENRVEELNEQLRVHDEKDIDTHCPTCDQALPADNVKPAIDKAFAHSEQLKVDIKTQEDLLKTKNKTYNENVQNKIKELNSSREILVAKALEGVNTKLDQNNIDGKELATVKKPALENDLKMYQESLKTIEGLLPNENDKKVLEDEISAVQVKIEKFGAVKLYTEEEFSEIEGKIEDLNRTLSNKDNLSEINENIQTKEDNIQLKVEAASQLDFKKMLLDDYLQTKNNILSESLKEYFSDDITFKFLNFTQKGDPQDVFILLSNGVPYSNLNTAAKIRTGFSMVQFFQDKKGLKLPILIDNRESIVIGLPEFDGQIVTCVATKGKKLTIGGN